MGLLRHRVGILWVGQQAVRVRLQRQESVHLRLVGHQAVHEVLDGLQDHRSTGHPQGARHLPKGRQDCQVVDNALRRLHQQWLGEAERRHLLLCKIPLSRTTTTTTTTTTVLLRCDRREVWDWTRVVRTARERALLHTVGMVREEHGTPWVWEEPVPMRVHREEAVLPKRQS